MVNIMLGVLFSIIGIGVWRICGVGVVLNKKKLNKYGLTMIQAKSLD